MELLSIKRRNQESLAMRERPTKSEQGLRCPECESGELKPYMISEEEYIFMCVDNQRRKRRPDDVSTPLLPETFCTNVAMP
jgi:hypothetical protein